MFTLRENISFLQFLNLATLVKRFLIDYFYRGFGASDLMFSKLNCTNVICMERLSNHFILINLTCETESGKELVKLFPSLRFRFEIHITRSTILEGKLHRIQQNL